MQTVQQITRIKRQRTGNSGLAQGYFYASDNKSLLVRHDQISDSIVCHRCTQSRIQVYSSHCILIVRESPHLALCIMTDSLSVRHDEILDSISCSQCRQHSMIDSSRRGLIVNNCSQHCTQDNMKSLLLMITGSPTLNISADSLLAQRCKILFCISCVQCRMRLLPVHSIRHKVIVNNCSRHCFKDNMKKILQEIIGSPALELSNSAHSLSA